MKTVRAINGIFGDFKLINFVVFNEFEFLKRIVKKISVVRYSFKLTPESSLRKEISGDTWQYVAN